MKRIVIALGGNALQEAGKPATAESQLEVVEKTSEYIADIIESGYDVVLAHGNGPQVGRIVLQNEYASADRCVKHHKQIISCHAEPFIPVPFCTKRL